MNHLQFQVGIGTIAVTWNSQGLLTCIDWYDNCRPANAVAPNPGWSALSKREIPPVLGDLVDRVRAYFDAGEPIGEVPWHAIDHRGWSEFQTQVYRALTQIPHGETRPYSWVARRVGRAAASRAVGQALRKNPLPILIPCHRVVGTNALGGFMGIVDPDQPELKLKQWLIEVEQTYLSPQFSFISPAWEDGLGVRALGAVG